MPGVRSRALLVEALAVGLALVSLATVPAAATADGLPVPLWTSGSGGVLARTSPIRSITPPAGRATIVARTAVEGRRVCLWA